MVRRRGLPITELPVVPAVIVRKVQRRDEALFINHVQDELYRVRLVHKPTGVQGNGEGATLDLARAAADADFAAHLRAAGLEL